jgi:hypothetical protein
MAENKLLALQRVVAGGDVHARAQLAVHYMRIGKGWFGEMLPSGLTHGKQLYVYQWSPPVGPPIEFVYVPSGEFLMGTDSPDAFEDETPSHAHPLTHDYRIARTPITWVHVSVLSGSAGTPIRALELIGRDEPPKSRLTRGIAALCREGVGSWQFARARGQMAGLALFT